MHTSTFWLKFGSLSPAVTLKIRSWSPLPFQLFNMSQCYIHVNFIKIHPTVHEISRKQETVTPASTPTPTPTPASTHQKQYGPLPSVGNIVNEGFFLSSFCFVIFRIGCTIKQKTIETRHRNNRSFKLEN